MRVGSLRKALKSRVHFDFLDAPFVAGDALSPEQIAEVGGSPSGRTWLKWGDQEPGAPCRRAPHSLGLAQRGPAACGLSAHQPGGFAARLRSVPASPQSRSPRARHPPLT